jgi:3-isopropylmalate dehydrogenase
MHARILLLPGDGVGPEVVAAARGVLDAVAAAFGHEFSVSEAPIGGAALKRGFRALPEQTLQAARNADAILLGAVGDPAFDTGTGERPEAALLQIRRELTGGLYYGEPRGIDGDSAFNTMRYSRHEVERIARVAFEAARARRRHVTSVDKANVLETSRLWRAVVTEIAAQYADVALAHMYVDACAMKIALAPASFDVILTENLFGDILSDEAGAVVGSLGLLPSASLGDGPGLFEPVHGSAPDIAGKDVANPVGAIASAAMLLRDGLRLHEEASAVEEAIAGVLQNGPKTQDLAASGAASCSQVGQAIARSISSIRASA